MRKYEFTDNEREYQQTTFRQIRALRDIPRYGVKAGDVGGWIEEELNLSQSGDCWVGTDSYILRSATVNEDAAILGKSIVDFRSRISGGAVIKNSMVQGINLISDKSYVADSHIQGQCIMSDDSRLEFSQVQGLVLKGNAVIINSQCYTRLGKLTVETGSFIQDTELRLMDNTPYLAENTKLINVEAIDVKTFRIYQSDIRVENERFLNGRRVKIGHHK